MTKFLIPFSLDPNALQLILKGELIGHLNKDCAAVLTPLMTLSSPDCKFYHKFKLDNYVYGLHVNMYCFLCYCNTSHRRKGYKIQVMIQTVYDTEWVNNLVAILEENKIEFIRLD